MIGLWLPLFVYIASLGTVLPNAAANAMAGEAHRAGTASALMGTLQFMLGAVTSGMVGALHSGTALPLAAIVAVRGLGGLGSRMAPGRERSQLSLRRRTPHGGMGRATGR